MNRNDQDFLVQKIRTQYTEKEHTGLDELKELDAKVKRPANVFAYIFGSIGAIIMGAGMSLVMTDIADTVGIQNPMLYGIVIGIVGMFAAYTFTAFTMAIINMVKYRKYNSPVYSASKAISLASACVSMLTLEATMLTTFGAGTMGTITRKIFLGCTGGVISVFVVVMAIYMIRQSSKKLKDLK